MKKFAAWGMPGLIVLILDRVVKWGTEGVIKPLIPGVLGLRSTRNTGMALGLLEGRTGLILLLSLAVILGVALALRGIRIKGLAPIALSLILGGAAGNMIDRLLFGAVLDMFELLFMDFYIFNVADVGVVCGAVLCGVSLLFRPQDWRKKA